MKEASFYLDAWMVAKTLNRGLDSIYKTSFTQYLVTENEQDETFVKELILEQTCPKTPQ